jgi:hypothetical protein
LRGAPSFSEPPGEVEGPREATPGSSLRQRQSERAEHSDDGPTVWRDGVEVATVDGNQAVAPKNVQVGQDIGSNVEILAGLSDHDRIIDSPLESLNNGTAYE